MAISQSKGPGSSEASTAQAPSTPRPASALASQREGRHSNRQGADAFDERLEIDIGCGFVSEEPAPEPIVLAVQ